MEREWVLGVKEQCRAANVPFFFKQWGGFPKSKAGRHLDGQPYDEMPVRTSAKVPERAERKRVLEQLRSEYMLWSERLSEQQQHG